MRQLVSKHRQLGRTVRGSDARRRVPRRVRHAVAAGAAAGFLVGGLAAPANATPPERFTETAGDDYTFEDECAPGVDLVGAFEETIDGTVFFDRDGDVVRIVEHISYRGTATRSDTGHTLTDRADYTLVFDPVEGTATLTGKNYNITYPATGPVFQDVGRRIFNLEPFDVLFVAGPADFGEGLQPVPEVCGALA